MCIDKSNNTFLTTINKTFDSNFFFVFLDTYYTQFLCSSSKYSHANYIVNI